MKFIAGTVLLAAGLLLSAPGNYTVNKADGFSPVIDGSLAEWPESALIDSLRGDQNVFARTATTAWTRDNFQMKVYAAYDSQWIYYAVKVIADNMVIVPYWNSITSGDVLKVNPGGQGMSFYISALSDSMPVVMNPSCPFTLNSTLKAKAVHAGDWGRYPGYEFAVKRSVLDPFCMGIFQLSVGTEDIDARDPVDQCFAAIGVDYTGAKQAWSANAWDNPMYYPSFRVAGTLVPPSSGQVVRVTDSVNRIRVEIPTTRPVSNPVVTIRPDTTGTGEALLSKVYSVAIHLDTALAVSFDSARLTFDYRPYLTRYGQMEKNLRVYYLNGSRWDSVGGVVDTAAKTVTVMVTHFSTYGLFATPELTSEEGATAVVDAEALSISPTPCNPTAMVRFSTLNQGAVSLKVYDVRGNLVRTLLQGETTRGSHAVAFTAKDDAGRSLSSGLYFVRLQSGSRTLMKPVQLMK